MLRKVEQSLEHPVDDWTCHECQKPIGWTLTNERSMLWTECWFIGGKSPSDDRLPKWCDECVIPSPIPHHVAV